MAERFHAQLGNWADGATRAHLCRYYVAKGFLEPGDDVVDAGCGSGYGSQLMSDVCNFVYGVDHSNKAIIYAQKNHMKENTAFITADLEEVEIPDCSVAVCIEVLEHLERPDIFAKRIMEIAKRLIIFTVPLDEEPGANPHHKQVFDKARAEKLFFHPKWKFFHSLRQGNHFIGIVYRIKEEEE